MGYTLTPTMEETRPRTPWLYLLPILFCYGALILVGVLSAALLPPDHIASHFNIKEQADAWISHDEFMQTFTMMALIVLLVNVAVVAIAIFGPRGRPRPCEWPLNRLPSHALFYVGLMLSMIDLLLAAVQLNVLWYNMRGVLLFPFASLPVVAVPLLIVMVAIYLILEVLQEPESP